MHAAPASEEALEAEARRSELAAVAQKCANFVDLPLIWKNVAKRNIQRQLET